MGGTVVFLGAGASKGLGLPLTKEILPELLERLIGGEADGRTLFGGYGHDQATLLRCLKAILPGLDRLRIGADAEGGWRDRVPLVTDVLSSIDYLLLSAAVPGPDLTPAELGRGRRLLERGMFELLVRDSADALRMEGLPDGMRKEWEDTDKLRLFPPRSPEHEQELDRAVDWLMRLAGGSDGRLTLISTNYDIEVEQRLFMRLGYPRVFQDVDFGTSVRSAGDDVDRVYHRPEHAPFGVYKLHGSLNWLRCDLCENIYVNPVGAIAYLSFLLGEDAERYIPQYPWLRMLQSGGANECHCGYRPLRHMIVAPSFVRDVRDPILLEVWRNALEALRQADRWIIVGYSLPSEDVAIRSMLLRAHQGRPGGRPPSVVVVQKGDAGPEAARYELLFSGRHSYVAGGLAGHIDAELGNGAAEGKSPQIG